jgi:hypothetical protein
MSAQGMVLLKHTTQLTELFWAAGPVFCCVSQDNSRAGRRKDERVGSAQQLEPVSPRPDHNPL